MISQQLSPKFLIYALALSICHGIPGAIPLLPTFQQEFNLNSYEVSSCLSYFSYSAFIGTPFSGYIYSKLPKKVYIFLVNFIFLVGILGIAFSPNYTCLLFFRVVQGLGSAGMNILIYLLPAEYYTGLERAKIMGKSIGYLAIGFYYSASYRISCPFLMALFFYFAERSDNLYAGNPLYNGFN